MARPIDWKATVKTDNMMPTISTTRFPVPCMSLLATQRPILPHPVHAYNRPMTELAPGSQTVVDERTELFEDGDQDRFSHYVPKDKLMAAMVNGTPVVALCGKVWVPTKNPDKFPVCPECKDIWESLNPGK